MVHVDGRVTMIDLQRVGLRLDGKLLYPVRFFEIHLALANLVLTRPIEQLLTSRKLSERLLATQIYDYYGDSYRSWEEWSYIVIHLKEHALYGITPGEAEELHHIDTFVGDSKKIPLCVKPPYHYDPQRKQQVVDLQRDETFYNTTNWGVCACKFPVELKSMTPTTGALKGITVKNVHNLRGLDC